MLGFGTTLGGGTTDVVTVPAFIIPQKFSFSVLAYRFGNGGSNLGRIYQCTTSDLFNNAGGNVYQFSIAFSTTTAIYQIARPATFTYPQLVGTVDAVVGTKPRIWLDGTEVTVTTSAAGAGTFTPTRAPLYIGNTAAGNRNWDGYLYEFALWSRILSSHEIGALARYWSPAWFPDHLVCYQPMNTVYPWTRTPAATVTGTRREVHTRSIYYPPNFYRRVPVGITIAEATAAATGTATAAAATVKLIASPGATTG